MTNQPRYYPTYRQSEVARVCELALRGQSMALLGVAGIGKGNLIQFLHDKLFPPELLRDEFERSFFVLFNLADWDGTPANMWEQMLSALAQKTPQVAANSPPESILSISRETQIFNQLRSRVEGLCSQGGQRIIFILDNFDDRLPSLSLAMLERLDTLRTVAQRDRLSYLLFCKRLPHVVGRYLNLERDSNFYRPIHGHIYALEPYSNHDARRMLTHLNQSLPTVLSQSQFSQILYLSGRHAGLTKKVVDIWVDDAKPEDRSAEFYAENASIRHECQRILNSLHTEEQDVMAQIACGEIDEDRRGVIHHLLFRGLVTDSLTPQLFSPILTAYLRPT